MKVHGWGCFPITEAKEILPRSRKDCVEAVKEYTLIARGLGRSYGDSANNTVVLHSKYLNHFIAFDPLNGILQCEAGVSIHEILQLIIPTGWFIPVTPGTSYITVGGAIASDVHGKNHHKDGTFSQHVQSLELLLGTGDIVNVSPSQHAELFYATCGGMGLTAVILSATIELKKIASSIIEQTNIKMRSLDELLEKFTEYETSTYSVAWLDCLTKNIGRSLLMLGEHANQGQLTTTTVSSRNIPINLPFNLLNSYFLKAFNTVYYHKNLTKVQTKKLPFEPFFYPLDRLSNWNRLYGKKGFIQYQLVLPKPEGLSGLQEITKKISQSGKGSSLAVLKVFGPSNQNYLSFPMEGYSLALDFKAEEATFQLIQQLNEIILSYGGKIYLTKDALMTEEIFKTCYPKWEDFEEVRVQYGAIGKFTSDQSRRLGLG